MKAARLDRLFHPKSRRCFDVAVDHGFFNEFVFISGIEDLRASLRWWMRRRMPSNSPSGRRITCNRRPARTKPALVLRTDVANVYGNELPGSCSAA